MPNYPVKPEGDLFEAVKDTLVGDHTEGRYARNVLGEDVELLDEAKTVGALVRQNIPTQCEEMARRLKVIRGNVQAIYTRKWEKGVDAQGHSDLRVINEILAQAFKRLNKAQELSEKVARAAHSKSK